MKRAILLSLIAGLATVAALGTQSGFAASGDWPQFRGDVQRTGNAVNESIIRNDRASQMRAIWATNDPGNNANATFTGTFSSSVTSGSNVYAGSGDNALYAINRLNGKIRWRYSNAVTQMSAVDSTPAVGPDGTIYFGDTNHTLYAVTDNGTSGGTKWNSSPISGGPNGPILSSPLIVGNMLFVGSADTKMYAFNLAGNTPEVPVWAYATAGPVDGSAAYDNGTLYFGSYDDYVYALDVTGAAPVLRWKFKTGGTVVATPAVDSSAGVVYAGSRDGLMYALAENPVNPSNPAPVWTQQLNGPIESSAALYPNGSVNAPNGGGIYVGTSLTSDALYALSPNVQLSGDHILWKFQSPFVSQANIQSPVHSSPAVADGVVFFGSFDGVLYGLDTLTGLDGHGNPLFAYDTNPVAAGSGGNPNQCPQPSNPPVNTQQRNVLIDASPTAGNGMVTISTHNPQCGVMAFQEPSPTALSYNGATSGDCSDTVTVSATLTNTGTGQPAGGATVGFTLGANSASAVTNGNGVATANIQVPPSASGSLNLRAFFTGSSAYLPAADVTVPFTVNFDESAMAQPGPSSAGANQSVTVGAVMSDPAGAPQPAGVPVTFTLGSQSAVGTTDSGGNASATFTLNQPVGSYTLQATSGGTPQCFQTATSSAPFTITTNSTRIVYTGPATDQYNDATTLSAQLLYANSGLPVKGEVLSFTLGTQTVTSTATDVNGNATAILTPNETPGGYVVTAAFAGSAFNAAASTQSTFSVTKDDTEVSYTGATTLTYGTTNAVSARIFDATGGDNAPPAGEQVVFYLVNDDNGNPTGDSVTTTTTAGVDSTTTNAAALLPVTSAGAVPGGHIRLVAGFVTDAYYGESTDNVDVTVKPGAPVLTYTGLTTVTNDPNTAQTFTATLLTPLGGPIAGRTIGFNLGGQTFHATTDSTGTATAHSVINLPAGTAYDLKLAFAGDSYWTATSADVSPFTVTGAPIATNLSCSAPIWTDPVSPFNLGATLTSSRTHAGIPSESILFQVSGPGGSPLLSAAAVTDVNGFAQVTFNPGNPAQGKYVVSYTFAGDGGYLASSCTRTMFINTWEFYFVDQVSNGQYRFRFNTTLNLLLFETCTDHFPSREGDCPNSAHYTVVFRNPTANEMTTVSQQVPGPAGPGPSPTDHMIVVRYPNESNDSGDTFKLQGSFDEDSHSFAAVIQNNGQPITARADCTDGPTNNHTYCSN
ncbi:MAG: outer membrane protein assembly factor BamB family protein [Candidatus Dormibacteria bacterium]